MRITNTARACVPLALSIFFTVLLIACGGDGGTQTSGPSGTDTHTSCELATDATCGSGGGSSSSTTGTAGGGIGGGGFDPQSQCVVTPADPTGSHLDKRCNGTCFCPNEAELQATCKKVGLDACPAGAISCARGCSLDMPLDETVYKPLDETENADCISNLSFGQWQDENEVNDTVFLRKNELGQYTMTGYLIGKEDEYTNDWHDNLIYINKSGVISASWRRSIAGNSTSIQVTMLAPDCSFFEHKLYDRGTDIPSVEHKLSRIGN